jgi:hypothetical protein
MNGYSVARGLVSDRIMNVSLLHHSAHGAKPVFGGLSLLSVAEVNNALRFVSAQAVLLCGLVLRRILFSTSTAVQIEHIFINCITHNVQIFHISSKGMELLC